jgi:hypothetical protein
MRAHSKTPYSGVCLFSLARCSRPMGLAQNPNQLNQAQPVLSEAAPATTTPPGDPLPPPPSLFVCVVQASVNRAEGFKVAGERTRRTRRRPQSRRLHRRSQRPPVPPRRHLQSPSNIISPHWLLSGEQAGRRVEGVEAPVSTTHPVSALTRPPVPPGQPPRACRSPWARAGRQRRGEPMMPRGTSPAAAAAAAAAARTRVVWVASAGGRWRACSRIGCIAPWASPCGASPYGF